MIHKKRTCLLSAKIGTDSSNYANTTSDALDKEIEVDIEIYLKLAALIRQFNDTINRRTMNIYLGQLYAETNEKDGAIIEIFSHLVQRLPNQEHLSNISEMELIVNYLDPVLSPICHCPDKNKLLVWLNRQDENTAALQPDAIIMATPQRTSDVKPVDAMANPEVGFIDLVRLGTFGRALMLRKSNHKAVAIQCVGYSIIFYLITEQNGVTIMTDILRIDVPKDITEIGNLLQHVDNLKRVMSLYAYQVEPRYKHARPLDLDIGSAMENVNPKRSKQKVAPFSLI